MKNQVINFIQKIGLHCVTLVAIAHLVGTMNVTCAGPGYQAAPPKEALRFRKHQ